MKKSHKYAIFGICIFLVVGHTLPWIKYQWPFNTNFIMRGNLFLAGILFFSVELADAEWDKLKHKSPQIIADDVTSSITSSAKDTKRRGRWTATRLGGIFWKGMGLPGFEGTLIAPEIAIDNKLSAGTFVHAKAEETEKERLPAPAKKMVEVNDMPTPYYLATEPSEVTLQNSSYLDFKRQWKQENEGENAIQSTLMQGFNLTRKLQEMNELSADSELKGRVQRLKEKVENIDQEE